MSRFHNSVLNVSVWVKMLGMAVRYWIVRDQTKLMTSMYLHNTPMEDICQITQLLLGVCGLVSININQNRSQYVNVGKGIRYSA